MISDATLAAAIERRHITAEQAQLLHEMEAARGKTASGNGIPSGDVTVTPDDEKLRFITGFADIFVTIGIGLFLGASAYFIQTAAGDTAMWSGVAVLAWLLAEFFTRKRRQAFPSIVLLLAFTTSVFIGLMMWLAPGFGDGATWNLSDGKNPAIEIAGLGAALAAAVHYWRFHVPITIAAGVASLCAMPIALFAFWIDKNPLLFASVVLLCGLLTFALAMRFDMSDPERLTRRTDIAFWLHLLAAPLVVHSLILGFLGREALPHLTLAQASFILVTFLCLALIAIVIDRRAILVAGMSYAGYAFGSLIAKSGFGSSAVPATLFVLGVFVLLLSALWQPLRRAVLALLPASSITRLPRSHTQGS